MARTPVPVSPNALRGIRYAVLGGGVLWAALGFILWALWALW